MASTLCADVSSEYLVYVCIYIFILFAIAYKLYAHRFDESRQIISGGAFPSPLCNLIVHLSRWYDISCNFTVSHYVFLFFVAAFLDTQKWICQQNANSIKILQNIHPKWKATFQNCQIFSWVFFFALDFVYFAISWNWNIDNLFRFTWLCVVWLKFFNTHSMTSKLNISFISIIFYSNRIYFANQIDSVLFFYLTQIDSVSRHLILFVLYFFLNITVIKWIWSSETKTMNRTNIFSFFSFIHNTWPHSELYNQMYCPV